MHIGIYGAGYLGTVISACLGDFGTPVTCFDEDADRIAALAQGKIPYYERNLEDVVRRNVRAGRLVYSTDIDSFLRRSDVIFLAHDSSQYAEDLAARIGQTSAGALLIVVSPVPVGTGRRIENAMRQANPKITVVSHPVFFTDGCAVEDFNWPDRILLGTSSAEAVMTIKHLYRPLVMRGIPVVVTNHETAELVREAANAFYATKISFINELAAVCEQVNADAVDLALALGLDKKIAPRCLQPGAAYGGPFAESLMDSLAQLARSRGVSLKILAAAREVNRSVSDGIVEKICRMFVPPPAGRESIVPGWHAGEAVLESLRGKELGVLGLAFKPNTNSIAGSSSIMLVRGLNQRGAAVRVYDPAALPAAKSELSDSVRFCENAYAAADSADALIVGTGWPEFRALDFERIRKSLRQPLIVDTKNLLDSDHLRSIGFQYVGCGRA
jgi:UDPglucose 6-dehydrogenase